MRLQPISISFFPQYDTFTAIVEIAIVNDSPPTIAPLRR